jgi:hypothetical protein
MTDQRSFLRLMLVASCGALCASVADASSPQNLPEPAASEVRSVAKTCTDLGGKPRMDELAARADLNADGRADIILDVNKVICDGAAAAYGNRERAVAVFVDDGRKFVRAFSDEVFAAEVEAKGARRTLWLTVSGSACGGARAEAFAYEQFCQRAIRWNAKTRRFDYAPVSTARKIP